MSRLPMTSFRVISITLLVVATVVFSGLWAMSLGISTVEMKSIAEAPDFTGTDLNGNEITLSDFRGQVVLLQFMYFVDDYQNGQEEATCPHCRAMNEAQMVELVRLHDMYSTRDLQMISVDMNFFPSPYNVEKEMDINGVKWPVIHDHFNGSHRDRPYGETAIGGLYNEWLLYEHNLINPILFLIDKDGGIVKIYEPGKIPEDFAEIYSDPELRPEDEEKVITADQLSDDIDEVILSEWQSAQGKTRGVVSLIFVFMMGAFALSSVRSRGILRNLGRGISPETRKLQAKMANYRPQSITPPSGRPGLHFITDDSLQGVDGKNRSVTTKEWLGTSSGLALSLGAGLALFILGVVLSLVADIIPSMEYLQMVEGLLVLVLGVLILVGIGGFGGVGSGKAKAAATSHEPQKEDEKGMFASRSKAASDLPRKPISGSFRWGVMMGATWPLYGLLTVLPVVLFVLFLRPPPMLGGLLFFTFALGFSMPVARTVNDFDDIEYPQGDVSPQSGAGKVYGGLVLVMGVAMSLLGYSMM